MSKAIIDHWYEFGSNYSYLSVMRIGDLARRAGIEVRWQPFMLGPIFKSFGWTTSPFVLQKEKGRYMWRDMERQCSKYGLAWAKPSVFPRRALLPMRVAMLARNEPWIEVFSKAIMQINFVHDSEIDNPEVAAAVLVRLGLDADAVLEKAQSPENKEALKQQTLRAQELGIFGGPSFIVNNELFWGNDRLEEALEFSATDFKNME